MQSGEPQKCPFMFLTAGASSIIFWWRRCTLQSLSNKYTALPWWSPNTWTSTCLFQKETNVLTYFTKVSEILHLSTQTVDQNVQDLLIFSKIWSSRLHVEVIDLEIATMWHSSSDMVSACTTDTTENKCMYMKWLVGKKSENSGDPNRH